MVEWYLHSKTQLPDDPLTIARQCNFGQDQLAKANNLAEEDHNNVDQETGRSAFYDNAIPTEYNHSIGNQKRTLSSKNVPDGDTPTGHTFCYLIPQSRGSATPATGGHIDALIIAGSFNADVNELEFGNVSANAVGAIAADAKMVVIATPRRLTFFKVFSFQFESDVGGSRECAIREKSRP